MKKLLFSVTSSLVALTLPAGVIAGSCDALNEKYPILGSKIVPTELGPKIISTVKVPVYVDDIDELNDAILEARMNAKNQISEFMSETIEKDCKRKTTKLSKRLISKDSSGEAGSYSAEKNKEIVCSTTSSTSALLKGVVDIAQCYEPGKYVKLTLGIKPSTLLSAAELSRNIREGVKSNKNFNNSSPLNNSPNNSNGLIPTEGFSYIDESF